MIQADFSEVFEYMSRAIAGLSNSAPFMAEAGKIGVHSVQDRIEKTKRDPDGRAWAPWKESTQLSRLRKGNAALGLLFDSGSLLRSINAKQGIGSVEIDSSAAHAGFLQDGTSRMSARPFMGWSPQDEDKITTAFNAWIDRSIS